MSHYLITSTVFDFDMFSQRAELDKGPRHTVAQIAESLGAEIFQPETKYVTGLDKLLAIFYGAPEHWSVARRLAKVIQKGDSIFCAGQDVGIPLAIMCKLKKLRLNVIMSTMIPKNRRFTLFMKLFGLKEYINQFLVNDHFKASILKSNFGLSDDRIYLAPEQTDAMFFTPGKGSIEKKRPLLASAGMEQRDYKTLAAAVESLDVDLKVCAFSPNASPGQKVAMPETLPENIEIRYFEFDELRDLYRSADIVVLSLLENKYSAGLTVLMEAMACGRPVIITSNEGLPQQFAEQGLVIGVAPNDVDGMKAAIKQLTENPDQASELAKKSHQHFIQYHTSEVYVDKLASELKKAIH